MSKYGSGVSMKSMMEMEMEEVEKVLDKYNVSKKDRAVVTDALKEAFFQWCHTNAMACYTDEMFRQMVGDKSYNEFCKMVMWNFTPYEIEKMKQTYAWYGDSEGLPDFVDKEDADEVL